MLLESGKGMIRSFAMHDASNAHVRISTGFKPDHQQENFFEDDNLIAHKPP